MSKHKVAMVRACCRVQSSGQPLFALLRRACATEAKPPTQPPPPLGPRPHIPQPPTSARQALACSLQQIQEYSEGDQKLQPSEVSALLTKMAKTRLDKTRLSNSQRKYVLGQVHCTEGDWTAPHVASAFRALSVATEPEQAKLIDALALKVNQVAVFERHQVAQCLSSLRHCEQNSAQPLLAVLAPKIEECTGMFRPQEVSSALYGLQHCTDSPELRHVLLALAPKISACPWPFEALQLTTALSGIGRCGDSTAHGPVLQALTEKFRECTSNFNSQMASTALQSLQRCNDGPEVHELLGILATKMAARKPNPRPTLSHIALSLHGLRKCSSTPELRQVLSILTSWVQEFEGPFNNRAVGMTLCGLYRCGPSEESCKLLACLAPKIASCSEPLSSQSACTALFGLQRFPESEEAQAVREAISHLIEISSELYGPKDISQVLSIGRLGESQAGGKFLAALTTKMAECTDEFTIKDIHSMLTELKKFRDTNEKQAFLKVMANKIKQCSEDFTDHVIGAAFSVVGTLKTGEGTISFLEALLPRIAKLQDMSATRLAQGFHSLRDCGETAQARAVMAALAPKVEASDETFDGRNVATCLYGLKNVSDSPELRMVLAALAPKVVTSSATYGPQELCSGIFGLRKCVPGMPGVEDILIALAKLLENCQEIMAPKYITMTIEGIRNNCDTEGGGSVLTALIPHLKQRLDNMSQKQAASISEVLQSSSSEPAHAFLQVLRSRQQGLASAGVADVPPGWSIHWDGSRAYYHHPDHGSQWSHPSMNLPDGWAAHVGPDGRTFFHHEVHGSHWELPSDTKTV